MPHGWIEIDEELCKGCDLCAAVCPYQLIQLADSYNSRGYRPALFTPVQNGCTGCTLCAMICPEAAITVFREATITTSAREPAPAGKFS